MKQDSDQEGEYDIEEQAVPGTREQFRSRREVRRPERYQDFVCDF